MSSTLHELTQMVGAWIAQAAIAHRSSHFNLDVWVGGFCGGIAGLSPNETKEITDLL